MNGIGKEEAETFLKNQSKLFDEDVAGDIEEAMIFLEDCMAQVFDTVEELREYWEKSGMDVEEMSDEELTDSLEVFKMSSGKLLVVEA